MSFPQRFAFRGIALTLLHSSTAEASSRRQESAIVLVNKTFHRSFGLRANQLSTVETCAASLPDYVGPRPDRYLKHRRSECSPDCRDLPPSTQAPVRG